MSKKPLEPESVIGGVILVVIAAGIMYAYCETLIYYGIPIR